MVAFGEKNGWDNWQGPDPKDEREHLAAEVLARLKQANLDNEVASFRSDFPPAHQPIISFLEKQAQSVEQLHFVSGQKIVFLTGRSYQNRQAYSLEDDQVVKLDEHIKAIGKSQQGDVFALAAHGKVTTCRGWKGEVIAEFTLNKTADLGITELIPFNDGKRFLLVSSEGIYLVSGGEEKLLHPLNDDNEEDWSPDIDMENAALSNDNRYIAVGDQCYDHRILDAAGNTLGTIGPQSSYPHFCLFSKDDRQLITNSCHFYNGVTIGVESELFDGVAIEGYTESEDYTTIDEGMRVYAGLSTKDYYILGDAYGYIRAINRGGEKIWEYFLGSTISGMTISEDERTLWVGSTSGMLHKLTLGKGHRDTHTIGSGQHYEEFRLLIWKDEPQIWRW